MILKPSTSLTEQQVESGLRHVIKDGLFTEAMVAFTGGTFLVAMAMQMGASNFQIGLLAALPTLCNVLQLASIWLVQKYRNRRALSVISSFLARFPLLVIAVLPFMFSNGTSVAVLIFLLFFHYAFGSISGASWNSWMKDLVPQQKLGTYFSYRSRLTQITNVVLSIMIALALDYIKIHHPAYIGYAYPVMFFIGGLLGMLSVYILSKTPEPVATIQNGHIFRMIRKPLADKNFRRLMIFNCSWIFSLNLATPFFSVYLMKTLDISLSKIIVLGIIGQISSILFLRVWGKYSDRFSNKTVIRICAPIYIGCLIAWSLVSNNSYTMILLVSIHIVSGMATGGINLAIGNIGLKLASKNDAIVYIAARSMVNAFVPAMAPLLGGLMADHFRWEYFFITSAVFALGSLQFLKKVKEEGELGTQMLWNDIVASLRLKVLNRQLVAVRSYVPNVFRKSR